MVRIPLLHDVDHALPANDVDPLARRVEEEIVGIAADRQIRDAHAGLGVVNQKPRRLPGCDEQSTVGLVERHGEIRFHVAQGPRREYRLPVPIDDRDLPSVGHVHEDARISVCELERLGMTRQPDLRGDLETCRVDRGQCVCSDGASAGDLRQ